MILEECCCKELFFPREKDYLCVLKTDNQIVLASHIKIMLLATTAAMSLIMFSSILLYGLAGVMAVDIIVACLFLDSLIASMVAISFLIVVSASIYCLMVGFKSCQIEGVGRFSYDDAKEGARRPPMAEVAIQTTVLEEDNNASLLDNTNPCLSETPLPKSDEFFESSGDLDEFLGGVAARGFLV